MKTDPLNAGVMFHSETLRSCSCGCERRKVSPSCLLQRECSLTYTGSAVTTQVGLCKKLFSF